MTLRILVCAVLTSACQVPYAGGARPVEPSTLDAHWVRAAPTPVIRQQQESDCGLAALAMVAGSWGRQWNVVEMAHRLPPSEHGLRLGALRDMARQAGLEAYAISASTRDLRSELAAGRPVLLGLVLPHDREKNRHHYEVAVAIDPRDDTVVTIDPASGDYMKRPPKILDIEWKAAGYAALVVVGDTRQAGTRVAP